MLEEIPPSHTMKSIQAECNRYKMILLEARTESLREKINECNKDTKKLYSLDKQSYNY